MRYASAVDRVARGEVVGAIEDHIGLGNARRQADAIDSFCKWDDFYFGIDGVQRPLRRLDLRRADRVGAVEDLALQVGEVDLVGVGDCQAADAGRREVERRRAAQAARADDERMCSPQLLLALDSELGKEDVPAEPEKLLVDQFDFVLCATVGDWVFTGSP